MEDLANRLCDVAVVLEVFGQCGVVAGQVSEVVLQVKDACGVWTSPCQKGRSAGRTHGLLQTDNLKLIFSIPTEQLAKDMHNLQINSEITKPWNRKQTRESLKVIKLQHRQYPSSVNNSANEIKQK